MLQLICRHNMWTKRLKVSWLNKFNSTIRLRPKNELIPNDSRVNITIHPVLAHDKVLDDLPMSISCLLLS